MILTLKKIGSVSAGCRAFKPSVLILCQKPNADALRIQAVTSRLECSSVVCLHLVACSWS